MGVSAYVGGKLYPTQDKTVGSRVEVIFNYNTNSVYPATIIRSDISEPFLTVFQLDDGRVVLATECQYSFKKDTCITTQFPV